MPFVLFFFFAQRPPFFFLFFSLPLFVLAQAGQVVAHGRRYLSNSNCQSPFFFFYNVISALFCEGDEKQQDMADVDTYVGDDAHIYVYINIYVYIYIYMFVCFLV